MQMLDVHLPTIDESELILTRHTQSEPDQRLALERLKLTLPEQASLKITCAGAKARQAAAVQTLEMSSLICSDLQILPP